MTYCRKIFFFARPPFRDGSLARLLPYESLLRDGRGSFCYFRHISQRWLWVLGHHVSIVPTSRKVWLVDRPSKLILLLRVPRCFECPVISGAPRSPIHTTKRWVILFPTPVLPNRVPCHACRKKSNRDNPGRIRGGHGRETARIPHVAGPAAGAR